MEKIGKHNYEAFLLDYMEGNLDEASMSALFAFFSEYPELKPEFMDELDSLSIDPPSIIFENKDQLKHESEEEQERVIAYLEGQLQATEKLAFEKELEVNPLLQLLLADYQKTILAPSDTQTFVSKWILKRSLIPEESLIAYSEGILTPAEKNAIDLDLQNDEAAQSMLAAYQLVKIEADANIVYEDKAGLKRRSGLVVYLNEYWKPLAIAASIVLLFGLFWMFKGSADSTKGVQDHSLAVESNTPETNNSIGSNDTISGNNQGVITTPNTNQYTAEKQRVIKRQNVPAPVQNDNVVPTPQPIANNTNQSSVDTNSIDPNNAIAMVNIDKSTYLYNYYEEKDDEDIQKQTERVTTKEYVAMKLNQAAWGEDKVTDVKEPAKKKLKAFDVLALIGKGLKKLGNRNSDAKKVELENGKGSEYVVTIGGVSVKRKSIN